MAQGRLYRSSTDRMIGGVAGGLAEYFKLDPALVRIAWVVAVFFGGFGILAYIILWIVLPEGEGAGTPAARIIEERYARGEIDRDEYLRLKKDLDEG
jgi:phage shock protein C